MSQVRFAQAETSMLDLIAPPEPGLTHRRMNHGRRPALPSTVARYMEVARKTAELCPGDVTRRMTLAPLQSIELAHQEVDIVFRTAGSSATSSDAMKGRYRRNIGSLRGHLAHQCDSAAINYGRTRFAHTPVGIS